MLACSLSLKPPSRGARGHRGSEGEGRSTRGGRDDQGRFPGAQAEGTRAPAEIAKRLKIGRASVYRVAAA